MGVNVTKRMGRHQIHVYGEQEGVVKRLATIGQFIADRLKD